MQTKPRIAYLDSQGYEKEGLYNHFLYQEYLEYFDIYQSLSEGKLQDFQVAIIPTNIDEIYLSRHAKEIQNFLQSGKIIVSFAQNFTNWLPGNNLYIPSPLAIKDRSVIACNHFIFDGISQYDLNYRRGVKGFFNRGYTIPPTNAEIILKDNQNQCVAYIDRHTTNGVILSTAGADLLGYGIFDTNTSRRMGIGLLNWINQEVSKHSGTNP